MHQLRDIKMSDMRDMCLIWHTSHLACATAGMRHSTDYMTLVIGRS